MQNNFILALLALFLFSCTGKDPVTKNIKSHQMALVIGNPVSYGEGDLLVFPIGANYNPEIKEPAKADLYDADIHAIEKSKYNNRRTGSFTVNDANTFRWDDLAKEEYVNSDETDFDMRNILFYNKSTGKSYILSTDTLHILSFAVHREFGNPLIFYRVVKRDINGDRKYNSADAVMLYVSSPNGSGFMQITPENEQFFDYFYYPETQSILIKTAVDIDDDKQFTDLDETVFREMRLNEPKFGKEIFPADLKKALKKQLSVLK